MQVFMTCSGYVSAAATTLLLEAVKNVSTTFCTRHTHTHTHGAVSLSHRMIAALAPCAWTTQCAGLADARLVDRDRRASGPRAA
jgi:hypothetical protein